MRTGSPAVAMAVFTRQAAGAHFHGFAGMGGRAESRVNDDGQIDFLNEDADHFSGLQAPVAADGRAQRP